MRNDAPAHPRRRDRIRQGIVHAGAIARPRWEIAKLIPTAGWPLTVALTLFNVVFGLLPVAFVVATSVLLGQVPAAVTGGADSAAWADMMLAFWIAAAAFVGQQVLAPLQSALGELVARRVDGKVTRMLMAASLRSPTVAPLENQRLLNELGDAGRELEHGFTSPGKACAGLLALVARYVQLAGHVVLIGLFFSWLMGVAVAAVVMFLRHGQRGGLRRYSQVGRVIAADRRRSDYLRDVAAGAPGGKEIRVFGLAGWLADRYRDGYMKWIVLVWAARRRVFLKPHLWMAAAALLVTAALLGSVGAEAAGALPLTNLVVTLQAVLAALRLGEQYPESDVPTQFGMNAYDAVRTFDSSVRAMTPATGPDDGDEVRAPASGIRFEGVGFGYPGENRAVFDGLELAIPAGRSTAIVGVNGAGKTTLVKLLARLQEPTKGSVRVDGVDVRELPVDGWRRHIAVIFQDYLRHDLSAAENIGFGAVEHLSDRDGIRAAADAAGILDALDRLPKGLDSPLARHLDGGVDLSGGQWQRVAIARALFALRHGASILVLDEPTANLDVRAEAQFYDEFVRLTEGMTTILVSHRFSTVRHADNIVVLEHGRVAEQGSHDELVRLGGRYAELFRLQASRFTDDAKAA
ncbi:ABC transporter ATP-binding protein [Polymorphospora sp. NPDC051019]|uniref:ABC transporter ATP-binding protein n=1 Tax=Polymorphospora sp. NPDC051019 TaxID=3155725 RepID=UPI003449E7FF